MIEKLWHAKKSIYLNAAEQPIYRVTWAKTLGTEFLATNPIYYLTVIVVNVLSGNYINIML